MGLKEAALDSPTFRSGFTHFSEQLDLVEKWLESYAKCIAKLSHEVGPFEALVNGFLAQTIPPLHISEAVLDHDYTLLALKRYGEIAKESWAATISGLKRIDANIVEPIRLFLHNDLRSFREIRRNLDQTQKHFDNVQSRYCGTTRTKEASSLREDAFQLHEARKAYLKASMDFSMVAPQLRMALDKMLVRVFSDQWRDMKGSRQRIGSSIEKWGNDIDRVRGWSREMENGEKAFRKEFLNARKQIEDNAELAIRPSRELEDYSNNVDTNFTSKGLSKLNLQTATSKPRPVRAEKQGWLNLRTVSGKPSRTVWLRRWFYVKNGIFGWLVQGSRSGGVEESERIGVLLCNVKSGNADDRRYVFEVKTKDATVVVQAETQAELMEWLAAFEVAKQKALEDPTSTESPSFSARAQDPAFAISPPTAPEFAASAMDSGVSQYSEEISSMGMDRSSTLPVPGGDLISSRNSFDVAKPRRSIAERDGDTPKDPASRIIQKLDLHRRPAGDAKVPASTGLSGGGIASLIAASHTSMPMGPGALPNTPSPETPRKSSAPISAMRDLPMSSLAPNTLANPPAPTNLSSVAVIVNGERGIGIGSKDSSSGMPSGIMANIWGSTNWGHMNRLAQGELKASQDNLVSGKLSTPPSPMMRASNPCQTESLPSENASAGDEESHSASLASSKSPITSAAPFPSHRKTISLDTGEKSDPTPLQYPNYYPLQLKTQDAQFRLLFPSVSRQEILLLVFKATWNPNDQQGFPGRVYVTAKEIYFYSNHCGMTLISSIDLSSISEVTAATGRDCDFIFCHLKEGESRSEYTRITIKTFLEPLNLLQRRLNFLVRNRITHNISAEEILKTLIRMEQGDTEYSQNVDSWDSISVGSTQEGGVVPGPVTSTRDQRDLRANLLIDRGLYGDKVPDLGTSTDYKTFKLPRQPIHFSPSDMDKVAVEKEFNISPKALFHVMFGDKSAVWQLLYHERRARHIRQGPWNQSEQGYLRRDFDYSIEYLDLLRRSRRARVEDHQVVEVANEHLLYVVSDRKRPWHLPYRDRFFLLTKVVITHLSKSKCKLAVHIKIDWIKSTPYAKNIIAEAALKDLMLDALDLTDVIAEQVRNFSSAHGRTKKAIEIFGQVGAQTQTSEFAGSEAPLRAQLRRTMKRRTMAALTFESFVSIMESIVTSGSQVLVRFIVWVWKIINVHYIILGILVISILVNIVFSSTRTSAWWSERKARKFMTHLGVGPDLTLRKAIFLRDFDEFTALDVEGSVHTSSQCRDTFNQIMNTAVSEPHYPVKGFSALEPQATTVRRLRMSRHTLGAQRHDLLVAMRVLNSVEREVVQAEWAIWLKDEDAKCRRLGALLRQNSTQLSVNVGDNSTEALPKHLGSQEEIKAWHGQHCDSCDNELELIKT